MDERVCGWCGADISHRRTNARSCSDACRAKAQHARRNPTVVRARWLRRKYGLAEGEFEAVLASQGDVCAICGSGSPGPEGVGRGRGWCVDHNHSTGAVRGVLCSGCNCGLGLLGDDPVVIRAAARYLRRSEQLTLL